MITLITGLPGAGKTLYALNYVKELAESSGRQVFYNGVSDLKLPWSELDKGEDWHTVPPGSIVLIDECQRVFRPRGNGSQVPAHVEKLETHRHSGIDLILITQHPMLAESNVRRLVGRHFHVVRTFGLQKSTVHEWGTVKDNCDKSRADSVRHDFLYPVASYQWYHSAEVHTHKARIPSRVYFLVLLPLLLIAMAYGVWRWYAPKISKPAPAAVPLSEFQRPPGVPEKNPADWIKDRQPRIAGLPATAPVYDVVTTPTKAPYPAACVRSAKKCTCFSQQATVLNVSPEMCGQIVEKGYFVDFADQPISAGPQKSVISAPEHLGLR